MTSELQKVTAHHSSFSIPVFISSWFNPSHLSLSSSVSAFVSILANRLPRLNPSSFIHLRSYALRVLYVFIRSSFHPVLLLQHSVHDSITVRSCPSWVCRVSNAHGGCDVYPTLASSILWVCHVSDARGGCNVYPVLAFLFYLVCPVTSRPSSTFRSPSLSCFCNRSSLVITSCQSAAVCLCPCLCQCQCLHGIAIVFPLFHHRIPVVIRSPDLWLPLWILGLVSLVSVSVICSVFSSSCSGATWFSLSITVYSQCSEITCLPPFWSRPTADVAF